MNARADPITRESEEELMPAIGETCGGAGCITGGFALKAGLGAGLGGDTFSATVAAVCGGADFISAACLDMAAGPLPVTFPFVPTAVCGAAPWWGMDCGAIPDEVTGAADRA